ncbi:aminopeptidase T. Metallo peptidase. MEROPS family M29 [Granulicella pectinivorans]|uniref:Aminopeptidase T. Metallo peptidase. MEROPS family M29 n=1 Tax=Granulicella pectinivorans TaxID=474950 RepID=A0A1I6N052_9BACT|nr:aminopeptidase [Granulicella pectinivorans]SFS21326.1 aminopeptidase T. Metallo peptidase. MEROPS family M29 [Granulicella pectinivorans]
MSDAAVLDQTMTSLPPFSSLTFEEKLDRFAEVAVRIGLNLADGQELLISAPVEAMPLVRRITEHAYKAGSKLVTTFYADDPAVLARYKYAKDESFDYAATWMHDGIAAAFRSGAARLAIAGANPALLKGQDPAKISRANVAASKAAKPAMEMITRHEINWSIVACATPEWAKLVFPSLPVEEAVAQLWEAIFTASRVTGPNPVTDWKAHTAFLKSRVDKLNEKRYHALRFKGPGTDLTVGLADDHLWAGGGGPSGNGIFCNPNIPTEECFTTPHKDRVDGYVTASKPLSHQGSLIENISCTFEGGKIVSATASAGEEQLNRLISTDDGARRLGEVALVPASSPIASSGVLFWNTLFDENAASHIALGQAYATCLIEGEHMDEIQLAAKGANASLIHVDWMIGSAAMDVDGLAADGTAEPLMRGGEWV